MVLATGGVGQLYAVTTNPKVATADGWALAHRAGARLRDLEFLQFHPTALKLPGVNPAPLISEAVRGAGAVLVDREGRRFALDADPRGELAPRDVLARAVASADAAGGAWLDARQVADFPARFPGITAMLARHRLDPARDLLPVAPALHYAMGGIQTDLEGRATFPGSGPWARSRPRACTAPTGSRPTRCSKDSCSPIAPGARWRPPAPSLPSALPAEATASTRDTGEDERCEPIRVRMRETMTADVGVQRTEASLLHAEGELDRLSREAPAGAWRTHNQLLVAGLITEAARRRRESRGGHRRADYPPAAFTREMTA